jgi:hypothetical protein
MRHTRTLTSLMALIFMEVGFAALAVAAPMPEVVTRNGHSALMVDGAPFLVLGAQVTDAKGKVLNSMSPHSAATLAADKRAFAALMRHLREADAQRTVIMVQVQNEPVTYGSVRDYGAAAQKSFDGPVPAVLAEARGVQPGREEHR